MSVPKSIVATLFVLCTTLLANTATASSITDFSHSGGTISGTAGAGLSLSGSMLIAVMSFNGGGLLTGDLGTVKFSTGALLSGSLNRGGTLGGGGNFTITGNGTDGLSGTLFSGTFAAPVSWNLATLANGTHNYTLIGVLTGTMGGVAVNAVTVQLTINTGKGFFDGSTLIAGGDTAISSESTTVLGSVPEPSTLALFGTGFVSMFGMLRRKIMA